MQISPTVNDLGALCVALLAIAAFLGMIWKAARLVLKGKKRLGLVFEGILGTPEDIDASGNVVPAVPSLAQRVHANTIATKANTAQLAQAVDQITQQGHRLDEHLTWHSAGGRVRSNGQPRQPVE